MASFPSRAENPTLSKIFDEEIANLKRSVKPGEVVLVALSGGCDSTVAVEMLMRAGIEFYAITVDHGGMRKGEIEELRKRFAYLGNRHHIVDASDEYFDLILSIENSEELRHIIRDKFIDVFAEYSKRFSNIKHFLQGTILTDTEETKFNIKTHHNAELGKIARARGWNLLEPLAKMRKTDVRTVGTWMGIPAEYLTRKPFPGPGGFLRCMGGDVTRADMAKWREADFLFTNYVEANNIKSDQCLANYVKKVRFANQNDDKLYNILTGARSIVWERMRGLGLGDVSADSVQLVPINFTGVRYKISEKTGEQEPYGTSEPIIVINSDSLYYGVLNVAHSPEKINKALYTAQCKISNDICKNLPISRTMFTWNDVQSDEAYIFQSVVTDSFQQAIPSMTTRDDQLVLAGKLEEMLGYQAALWFNAEGKPYGTIESR